MPEPAGLTFVLGPDVATLRLPETGGLVGCRYKRPRPQEILDARELHLRRAELHVALAEGLAAIKGGRAEGVSLALGEQYQKAMRACEDALWESSHLAIALMLEPPAGVDLIRALGRVWTGGLIGLANAIFAREGLSPEDLESLRRGVLEDAGRPLPDPDGAARRCDCGSLHGFGRCPTWPPYAWTLRAKAVWDAWRTAQAGGAIDVTLAYLDGAALIDRISAEISALEVVAAIDGAKKPQPEPVT